MRRLVLIAILFSIPALASDHEETRIERLAWLAGSWCSESETATAEEHWFAPRGGVLLGVHRDVRQGRPAFFEFLRIVEEDGDIVYYASPAGREATPFRMVESEGTRVVFANPQHDYPQRIIYERDGTELTATVEGDVEGEARSSSWRWRTDGCAFLEADKASTD